MNPNNTDLTEEDAADLQFPKVENEDISSSTVTATSFLERNQPFSPPEIQRCPNCFCELIAPFIRCAECHVNICRECFSRGAEFMSHHSDHDYQVLQDSFCLFEHSDWTAAEELKLLNLLIQYNNWEMVAKHFPKRSLKDIVEHYDYFYLQRKGSSLLPRLPERRAAVFPEPPIPYLARVTDGEEPPRYWSNHTGYNFLAGYNAARAEFEIEYNRTAEDLMSNLQPVEPDDPDIEILSKLQCAIVRIYNRRLQERLKRKQIMREHGLITYRKTSAWLHRFDVTITRNVYARLIRFMQFYSGQRFEFMMEGLHKSGELRYKICRLLALRQKGVTTLAEARLYNHLEQAHENGKKSLKALVSDSRFNFDSAAANSNSIESLPSQKKRAGFTPIDIVGMPGYEKLHPKERDLCKNVRLVPVAYLEFKDILMTESKKMGYLKLQQARKLLKIDVNKTRRLYDFLMEEGYIDRPPH